MRSNPSIERTLGLRTRMNFNISVVCDVCSAQTNCRLGLSNRPHQPLRFRCNTCGAPIDATMTPDFEAVTCEIKVGGARQIDDGEFTRQG